MLAVTLPETEAVIVPEGVDVSEELALAVGDAVAQLLPLGDALWRGEALLLPVPDGDEPPLMVARDEADLTGDADVVDDELMQLETDVDNVEVVVIEMDTVPLEVALALSQPDDETVPVALTHAVVLGVVDALEHAVAEGDAFALSVAALLIVAPAVTVVEDDSHALTLAEALVSVLAVKVAVDEMLLVELAQLVDEGDATPLAVVAGEVDADADDSEEGVADADASPVSVLLPLKDKTELTDGDTVKLTLELVVVVADNVTLLLDEGVAEELATSLAVVVTEDVPQDEAEPQALAVTVDDPLELATPLPLAVLVTLISAVTLPHDVAELLVDSEDVRRAVALAIDDTLLLPLEEGHAVDDGDADRLLVVEGVSTEEGVRSDELLAETVVLLVSDADAEGVALDIVEDVGQWLAVPVAEGVRLMLAVAVVLELARGDAVPDPVVLVERDAAALALAERDADGELLVETLRTEEGVALLHGVEERLATLDKLVDGLADDDRVVKEVADESALAEELPHCDEVVDMLAEEVGLNDAERDAAPVTLAMLVGVTLPVALMLGDLVGRAVTELQPLTLVEDVTLCVIEALLLADVSEDALLEDDKSALEEASLVTVAWELADGEPVGDALGVNTPDALPLSEALLHPLRVCVVDNDAVAEAVVDADSDEQSEGEPVAEDESVADAGADGVAAVVTVDELVLSPVDVTLGDTDTDSECKGEALDDAERVGVPLPVPLKTALVLRSAEEVPLELLETLMLPVPLCDACALADVVVHAERDDTPVCVAQLLADVLWVVEVLADRDTLTDDVDEDVPILLTDGDPVIVVLDENVDVALADSDGTDEREGVLLGEVERDGSGERVVEALVLTDREMLALPVEDSHALVLLEREVNVEAEGQALTE